MAGDSKQDALGGHRGELPSWPTRWWIEYYVSGEQIRESSGSSTKAVAQKSMERRLGKKREDGDLLQAMKIKKLRYEDWRAAYVADYVTNARESLRFDKDGKPRLDNFFGGYAVSAITTDKMREFSTRSLHYVGSDIHEQRLGSSRFYFLGSRLGHGNLRASRIP